MSPGERGGCRGATGPAATDGTPQNCCKFWGETVFDSDYAGLAHDSGEGARLAAKMGKKNLMLQQHHGVFLCADSLHEAFDDVYYLEKAASIQLKAMAGGREPVEVTDETMEFTKCQFWKTRAADTRKHFDAAAKMFPAPAARPPFYPFGFAGERSEASLCPSDLRYPETITERRELAACNRFCHQMGFDEGICNHISLSVQLRCGTPAMLLVEYGLKWSQVTASNLVLVGMDGEVLEGGTRDLGGSAGVESTAFCIHRAIHVNQGARANAIIHTHQENVTALCSRKGGRLEMVHQQCLMFHDEIAYDGAYNGLAEVDEGERLSRALGDKRVLLQSAHGVFVVGSSLAQAFDDLYYLDRCASLQNLAASTGRELLLIDEATCRKGKAQIRAETSLQECNRAAPRLHFGEYMRPAGRGGGLTRKKEARMRALAYGEGKEFLC